MTKIKKILMSNRGEISLRVLKTCRELGIQMVSLSTLEEKDYPHALEADQNLCLGSGPLSETYLNMDKILRLAIESGCDAIHPGYGFLSENPVFAKKVEDAGLIFIGPQPEVMILMGDKQSSKKKMQSIGVPLIPGYHGDNQSEDVLLKEAQKIGLPLLIKASAGGGGKGMRIVRSMDEFMDALHGAKREALNAFGDDKILLEKFIENPRHIEIQVFSDTHRNHLHLFERECSIQRRYQKIIEESPSPFLTDELRQKMCEAAVKITSEICYKGAGTIEFMVDHDGFYFLEMNTRLQVEHPVTEMVTGLDLVKWQILVASGEKLPLKQSEVKQTGHSFEVRLYAENPDQEFLPTTGKILSWGKTMLRDVRLDTGYYAGNEVGMNFDPMLAKLVVWAPTREEARHKMLQALREVGPLGLVTNNHYTQRVLKHQSFIKGETWTHFLSTHAQALRPQAPSDETMAKVLALSLMSFVQEAKIKPDAAAQSLTSWDTLIGFRNV